MHFEPRLWQFTEGLRLRILGTTLIGLIAVGLGIARLALLGWLIGQIFAGHDLGSLALPILLIAVVMVLRGLAEHWRVAVAHRTAARVQKTLRRTIYDRIAALGPGTVGRRRSARSPSPDRRGGAARGLFRPVPAAVPDRPPGAGHDLRRHRLPRSAGGGCHAGLRAAGALRASALASP
jgi:ABC-type multidrug transport system fused ATPase/permease subunit